MRNRLIALMLAVFLVFPVQVFALGEETAAPENAQGQAVELEEATESNDSDAAAASEESAAEDPDFVVEGEGRASEVKAAAAEQAAQDGNASGNAAEENGEEPAEEETEEIDYSVWTTADFTYTEYSQRLYGCDYSRDFTVSGTAIAGFSETGLKKVEKNKDLVLPSQTDTGEDVVGVANSAFYGMGLTSVKFPTGMYVSYNDELTHYITERGNFVIAENAFANNELTSVKLPDGVIAVMSNAFMNNKLTTVTLPKTIWWMETQCFAKNQITKVNFPERTWFSLEMHGMAFANNKIKSVRLPDTTAVVNKHTFMLNPGMEALPAEAAGDMTQAAFENSGVVYMYTDNAGMADLDRIHHIEKTTASTKSWFQKLVINDGTPATQNPDTESWNKSDFTYEGGAITGLSASGIEKRKTNTELVLPDYSSTGELITEIADGPTSAGGMFATADEKFTSVSLPSGLKKIGANVFREAGLTEVDLPPELEEIGQSAFMMNSIETVVLPDTVTKMGSGAFTSNKTLRKIVLSKNLTEVPNAAFACSDMNNWMADLTSIVIPEGVTKIGVRAFAGNNFKEINIPEGVTEIGEYAFSTKNYLMYDEEECKLTLPESLVKIGNRAFRNKLVSEVVLPASVEALPALTFEKMLSTYGTPDIPGSEAQGMVTKVYVSSRAQYEDSTNFPASEFHKLILTDTSVWTAEDFTYGEWTVPDQTLFIRNDLEDDLEPTLWVVTGFSDAGKEKFKTNQNLVIPAADPSGKKVQGIGPSAFRGTELEKELGLKIKTVKFPENVKAENDKTSWNPDLTERGDFFIASAAFTRNEISSLDLPEGVILVDSSAFAYNQLTSVSFPSTITLIKSQAFASNQITTLDFPEKVDYCLNIENMAFAINKVVSVQLPDNVGVMGALRPATTLSTVFLQNTGVEPVTGGNAATKKGGIVYMYKKTDTGIDLIYNTENEGSYVQKLVIGEIPSDESPWGVSDFTYDEAGTTVTGLTDTGKSKLKKNPDLVIPDKGPSGEFITTIGPGVMGTSGQEQIGTFGFREEDTPYVPLSVRFPSNLEKIDANAFSSYIDTTTGETKGLTKADFPETLTEIGATAFQNAPITEIILPNSLTTMGNGAFTGTIYASKIVLSDSLKSIPSGAFVKTNNAVPFDKMAVVEELVIPEGTESIGNTAFQGSKIAKLTLPEGVKTIGSNAFNNHQLTELVIPGSVTSVGSSAFAVNNESIEKTLASLEFGEGFDGTIAANAFRGHALTDVEIPAEYSFDKIKAGAFNDTVNKVKLHTSNEAEAARYAGIANKAVYTFEVVFDKLAGSGWSAGDFTYSEDGTALTGYSESGAAKYETLKELVLPDYAPDGTLITEIGEKAFAVPESQVDIGKYEALSDGITSVDLPQGLVKIGANAFEYNMLTEIDFKSLKSIKEIGSSAFHGNHLASVYLPDTIDTMGDGAFAMNAITELRLSEKVTVIPQGAFSMNIRMSEVNIPNTVTEIGDMAFAGARLTTLTIPKSVTRIGRKAFHLHHLDTLTIPGNVKVIDESAFEGTFKEQTLLELHLEEGIETIGRHAFKEGLLTSAALPSSVTTMGEEPFENNTGTGTNHVVILTSVNPDHVKFNDGAKYHLVIVGENVISLNAQPGTVDPGYLDLAEDGTIAADTIPVPTAPTECYSFDGWYTERTGGKEVTTDTVLKSGNVIYAHWKENHLWGEGTLVTAPTADKAGAASYVCQRDPSHTKTETINFAWEAADFTYDGDTVTGLSPSGKIKVTFNPDMVIPDKAPEGTAITAIGDEAFRNTAVETVKYPAELKTIGKLAFHTTQLKEAVIPDTVTSVGAGAYAMNWNLGKISLPDGLTEIPAGLFNRQLVKGEKKYDDYPSVGEVVIPDSVKTIGMSAFFGLSITKVTLPAGLTEMGQSAFANNKIAEVEIPGTLKDIPRQAFSRGKAMFKEPVELGKLTLNEGTETIGTNAFENHALRSVQLPESMKSIEDTAFRVGLDIMPDDEKVLLRGTPEQHADKTLNTGNGLGHKFAPLITFDPKGGTLEKSYAEVNDEYKLDEMPVPVMEDCQALDAWCTDAECSKPVEDGTVFKEDTTLYARWKESHDYVRTVIEKPTADKEGQAEYVCSRNPEHRYTEVIPKLTPEEIEARDEALEKATDSIIRANSMLASGEYTAASYAAMRAVIDAANELYDDPTTTEADVKAAEAEIAKAVRKLEPVDKAAQTEEKERNAAVDTLTRNIIDANNTVAASAYNAASYAAFKQALEEANAALDSGQADSAAINKANNNLLMAWKNLEKKAKQPMKVKAKTIKVRAKVVKKKAKSFSRKKAFKVTSAKGKVTYKKVKGNKRIVVAKNGKIKVKKGLKKGTYKVKVKVTAAGNDNYKAGSKTVTLKVVVR